MKLMACTRLNAVEMKQLEDTEFLNQGSESFATFAVKSREHGAAVPASRRGAGTDIV